MAKRFDSLSIADARRIALAAQGFDTARPKTKATQRHVDALISRLGVIQIDSVNVLVRSQELPLFARLGNHDRNAILAATMLTRVKLLLRLMRILLKRCRVYHVRMCKRCVAH